MTEKIIGIGPRKIAGEVIPDAPEGKVPTRLHGVVVFVSERGAGESLIGKSPYTMRQVRELADMLQSGAVEPKVKSKQEKGGPW